MLLVIQGTVDVSNKLTEAEISKTIDFCLHAFHPTAPEKCEAVLRKREGTNGSASVSADENTKAGLQESLSMDELRVLKTTRARQMLRMEDVLDLDNFSTDAVDGVM